MINIDNVAAADQLQAAGRAGFANATARAQQLSAQGLDQTKVVAQLVAEIGGLLLATLGTGDDEQFWTELWNIASALAFGAVEKGQAQ
jgi:hypothetical protein